MPSSAVDRALQPVGGFLAMCLDTAVGIFRRPFQLREYLEQTVFIARVSIVPAIMLTIPFLGVVMYNLNELLGEIGAIDFAGAGVGLAVIREIGPLASVLVVAGAGATAICADLGSRKIREELDAMEVLGVDPVQRLVVPRVLASATMAVALNTLVSVVAIVTGYLLSVAVQGASPGQFIANLNLLTGLPDLIVSTIKAAVFGLGAGLVACYRGLTAGGGSKGVGEAVNQTVILAVIVLFVFNVLISAIYMQLGIE
ncbi:phospholipid/cholesterol/gamma-HCH transport system permease protein [Amycolatopsis marina]|uniref:Phospholipid/cholesterol/gamma-HCH transport system permease protein n=1 Tax=Amycolatopsis marina TaxID=490629 RepID=A0A1I0YLU8_9PSEU|nr:ABC transporter permease [Amycolatopsis marina]SFB13288.1 phospholipid/cholesterol/gamma-HCH transport system permease protein [Amycolatopsis marina]